MPLFIRKNYETFRERLFHLLEPKSSETGLSFYIDLLITTVILVNVSALTIATLPELSPKTKRVLDYIEIYSVFFFTVELLLRWWVHVEHPKAKKYLFPRLYFFITPFAIIDILAIAPFYLIVLFNLNIKFLFLLRLFRLLKLTRYFKSLQLIGRVFISKRNELFISVFFTFTLLVFISFLMFYIEGPHQPEFFGSVPKTMWWGIITLTTVGYGDVVPITVLGKVLGGCIALLGVGLFALPAGILASGFNNELDNMTKENDKFKPSSEGHNHKENSNWKYCPHCGEVLEK